MLELKKVFWQFNKTNSINYVAKKTYTLIACDKLHESGRELFSRKLSINPSMKHVFQWNLDQSFLDDIMNSLIIPLRNSCLV